MSATRAQILAVPFCLFAGFSVMGPGPTPSFAQLSWEQSSVLPTSWALGGVAVLSPTHAFVCGADLVLMETVDGGKTWEQVSSVPRDPNWVEADLRDMDFVGASHGWVVGNATFRTSDGGQTWSQITSLIGTFYQIDMLTTTTGYARSSFSVRKTTDGGETWSVAYPTSGSDRVNSMDWWDASRGAIFTGPYNGSPLALRRTTDGGASWELVQTGTFLNVTFVDAQTLVWSAGYDIYRSTDFGETAQLVLSDPGRPYGKISLIHPVGGPRVVAMDEAHRFWLSTDSGATWTRTAEDFGVWHQVWPDIDFLDDMTGWSVSEAGLILKTTDGGASWSQASRGLGVDLNGIEMYADGRGVAYGTLGTILLSDDYGRTWRARSQIVAADGFARQLIEADRTGDTHIWMTADNTVFRSTDRGDTWEQRDTGLPDGNFSSIDFPTTEVGYLFGNTPPFAIIYETTDAGLSWQGKMVFADGIQSGHAEAQMFNVDEGVSIGTRDNLFRTSDGWDTWEIIPVDFGDEWISLSFADRNTGWVGGLFGTLAKTTNGGTSWTQQVLPDVGVRALRDVIAMSPSEAYVLASGGPVWVYHTTDGGNSWTRINTGLVNPDGDFTTGYGLAALSGGSLWSVGFEGYIVSRLQGIPIVGTEDGGFPPVGDRLSLRVAPNPTASSSSVHFELGREGRVRIDVVDVLGRVVSTPADRSFPAGRATVHWDGSSAGRSVPNGVYFFRVRAPEGTARGRIIVSR